MALAALRGEKEFRKVRAHGAVIRDPLFTLRVTEYRPRHGEAWRPRSIVGIVVPKKTLRRAVDRNRARRRVREAMRTLPGGLPPCRAMLMPMPAVLTHPFADLQAALARAFARAPGKVKGQRRGSRKPDSGEASSGKAGDGNAGAPRRVPADVPSEQQAAIMPRQNTPSQNTLSQKPSPSAQDRQERP